VTLLNEVALDRLPGSATEIEHASHGRHRSQRSIEIALLEQLARARFIEALRVLAIQRLHVVHEGPILDEKATQAQTAA
jgi:hypothetical protein